MPPSDTSTPPELDPDTICFTVDVEWAAPVVLDDLRALFDMYGVRATFFSTHAGVNVPGHERGIHPNFRRNGDTYRSLLGQRGGETAITDDEFHSFVISTTLGFAPEAKGVRTHSLYYDSTLVPLYSRLGIEYDCSYQMPLVAGLRPFWKSDHLVQIPTYFADHFDIMCGVSGFDVTALHLDRPGLKIFDFHPNIIYLNSRDNAEYMATKEFYHDAERLLAARNSGRGARTLLIDLLEAVGSRKLPTATAGEINAAWRATPRWT